MSRTTAPAMRDEPVPGRSAWPCSPSGSAVGLAGVDEGPEKGVAPGLGNRGGGGGGLLTPELAGHALAVRFADAVLDGQPGEVGFHGVHIGLLTWDRVDQCDVSILAARRGILCSPANTSGDRSRTVADRPPTNALAAVSAEPNHARALPD